jgi:hypothetical protein
MLAAILARNRAACAGVSDGTLSSASTTRQRILARGERGVVMPASRCQLGAAYKPCHRVFILRKGDDRAGGGRIVFSAMSARGENCTLINHERHHMARIQTRHSFPQSPCPMTRSWKSPQLPRNPVGTLPASSELDCFPNVWRPYAQI